MTCEKCGKEISENETICSCCTAEEAVAEQNEVMETVAEVTNEPVIDMQELGAPVSTMVRNKRSKARVITGIVSLVLMVAVLVVSFLPSVLIIGEWKVSQTIPTGSTVDMQVESSMLFTPSGETVWSDFLVNYKDVGYPEEGSKIVNDFTYTIEKNKLSLVMAGEQQEEQKLEVIFSINPRQLSYWPDAGSPRTVYDYYRNGFLYPSMYLWLAALVLLILGVLLLVIPGKKYMVTVREEAEEDTAADEITVSVADGEIVDELTEMIVDEATEEPQE